MMLKSKSTTDILTQTDSSYRQYRTLCTSVIEHQTVESFDKHVLGILKINLIKKKEKHVSVYFYEWNLEQILIFTKISHLAI